MATKRKNLTYHITYIAMCIALLTVSAWITVPFVISFTLQTLAVFWIAAVSHWKQSITAICLYLVLGSLGAPIFSGFQAGPSVLFHVTGGYLIGFVFSTLVIGLSVKHLGRTKLVLLISMLVALLLCYACGTAWYMLLYTRSGGTLSLFAALCSCVFPFILPDLLKIALAIGLAIKLEPQLLRLKP